jgi:hypothetical protein
MTQQSLEARIKMLEDIEDIKKLMFNYTYWLDYGEQEKVIDCFIDNAVMDVQVRGEVKEDENTFAFKFEGKEALRNFYNIIVHEKDRFSASHLILNPVVDVQGDRAAGRFYLLEPTNIARAMWGHGRYDMEFVRVDDLWKISFFGFLWNFNTPYVEGWDKIRMAIL